MAVVVVVVVVVHVVAAMAEHVYGPHVIRLKRPHVPLHMASQDCPAHKGRALHLGDQAAEVAIVRRSIHVTSADFDLKIDGKSCGGQAAEENETGCELHAC